MEHVLELFDAIGVLARRRYQTAERYFARLGLNHSEARLLTLLNQEGGEATQEALSNLLNVDRSNAGRALKSLEHEGYVERYRHDEDRRTNLVRLTERGRGIAGEIATLKVVMARGFFGELTEEQAGEIVGLLRRAHALDV
ncbi:MAG: MarR family transcriptional regulator [Chloroflexota bacterium]